VLDVVVADRRCLMRKTVVLVLMLAASSCAEEGVADLVGGEAGAPRRGSHDSPDAVAAPLDVGAPVVDSGSLVPDAAVDLSSPDVPGADAAGDPTVEAGADARWVLDEAGRDAPLAAEAGPEVALDAGREAAPEAGPEVGARPEAGPEARACDPSCHVGCYVGCTALGSCVACPTCTCETGTGACHC
jgi:hypothetical protein